MNLTKWIVAESLCLLVIATVGTVYAEDTRLPTGTFILTENSVNVRDIVRLINPQKLSPGRILNIATYKSPPLKQILRQMPPGTRLKGEQLLFPNKAVVNFLCTVSDKDAERDFAAMSYTPQKMIQQIKSYKSIQTVSVKRPGERTFTLIGTTERAIKAIPSLPDGTQVIAHCKDKALHYDYPLPHIARSKAKTSKK